jgi:hypothetical protein
MLKDGELRKLIIIGRLASVGLYLGAIGTLVELAF